MNTIVVDNSPRRRTTSSCMSRRITGSSAENGSSKSTSGPVASAGQSGALLRRPRADRGGRPRARQPDQLEEVLGSRPTRVLADALHLQPEGHVVDEVTVGEQAEVLEHHAHAMAAQVEQLAFVGSRDVDAADLHRARGRLDEARQAADERGLPAPGQAHDDEHLAVGNVEVDLADGDDIAGPRLQLAPCQLGQWRTDDPLRPCPEDLPQPRTEIAPHGRILEEAHEPSWTRV